MEIILLFLIFPCIETQRAGATNARSSSANNCTKILNSACHEGTKELSSAVKRLHSFPLPCQVHRVLVCTHRLSWLAKCILCEHEATLGLVTHQSQERQSSPSAGIPLIPGPAVCVRPTFLLVNWANCFLVCFF